MKRETFLQFTTLIVLAWLCFFVHSCSTGDPRNTVPTIREITRAPLVQVGLSATVRVDEAKFRITGPCIVGGEEVTGGIDGAITVTEYGLRIGDMEFDTIKIRIKPVGEGSLEIQGKGKWIRYRGDLLVLRDRDKVSLVNEVDLENYLAGVVGKEMSLSKGRAALKAQVIAARTYAMCEVKNGRLRKVNGEKFDLWDDQRSQVYGGMTAERDLAREIVTETRGMFVVWEDRLVNTFYSSTCGGHTDASWKVLGEGRRIPPLAGTACGYCEHSPVYKWDVSFTPEEMAKKLFKKEAGLRVQSVRILESLPGGHAVKVAVKLKGHDKERYLHANTEFRRRLRLKSSLIISIKAANGKIMISGRGWGHGAGMCQYGAYGMAAAGKSAIEIMKHYFPGADVRQLY